MELSKWNNVKRTCHLFIVKYPENAQAHFFMGIYYKHIKDIDASINEFNICIKYDEHYFLAYINLIRILKERTDFIKTVKIINTAKYLFPEDTLIYIESSGYYLQMNNINEALIDIKIAIQLNPKSETAQYNYAIILNKIFNDYIKLKDSNTNYNNITSGYNRPNNYITDKNMIEYTYIYDYMYSKKMKEINKQMLKTWEVITEEDVNYIYRKTLIQYMKIYAINRYNTNALCNYASVIAKYGDRYFIKSDFLLIDATELLIQKKIKESNIKKEQARIYNMYGIQYNFEAETKFLQVLEIDPSDYLAHFNLGLVLKSLNQIKKAKHHFIKALESKPSYENAKYELDLLNDIK